MRKTASKFVKEILKIGGRCSLSLEYVEFGFFTLSSVCIERQRNEQKIMHNACATKTTTVLVDAVVDVCLFNSLKPNKRQNNEHRKEHKTKESPTQQKNG